VKQRIIERVAIALSLVIGAVVVGARLYLRREGEQYSREVEEIKQPRLALPHFSVWSGQDEILADASNAPARE